MVHRQIEGHRLSRKLERTGSHHVTAGLSRLTCYPPDQFIFLQSENIDELVPSFAAAFSNVNPDILASADEDGVMRLFDTTKRLSNGFISGFEAHNNAVFDIAWAHDEPWIITASGDQTAVLWDAPTGEAKAVFRQHTGSLKSVSFGFQSNSILATGARDGSILIWDTRCSVRARSHPVPVATIIKAHEDRDLSLIKPRRRRGMPKAVVNVNPLQSVTAVIFQSSQMLLSSGTADGIIKMWDIRSLPKKQKKTPDPYHSYHYSGNSQGKHGFSSLTMDSSHSRFYANCTDGIMYAYDCVGIPGSQPAATYSGHANSTFYVKSTLSPDDQYLLSGSSDFNAYIWKVNEPEAPPVTLSGHSGEVTAVAWSPVDYMKVVTCADDCSMRIWRMKSEGDKEEERPIGEAKWDVEASSSESSKPKQQPSVTATSSGSSTPGRTSSAPPSEISSPQRKDCSSPKQATPKRGHFSLKAWATPSPKRVSSLKATPVAERALATLTTTASPLKTIPCAGRNPHAEMTSPGKENGKSKSGTMQQDKNKKGNPKDRLERRKDKTSGKKEGRLGGSASEETLVVNLSQDRGGGVGARRTCQGKHSHVAKKVVRTGKDHTVGQTGSEGSMQDKIGQVAEHSRTEGNVPIGGKVSREGEDNDRCSSSRCPKVCLISKNQGREEDVSTLPCEIRNRPKECAEKLSEEQNMSGQCFGTSLECNSSPSRIRPPNVSKNSCKLSNSKQSRVLNLRDWMKHSPRGRQNVGERCNSDSAGASLAGADDAALSLTTGGQATVAGKENKQPDEERRVPSVGKDAEMIPGGTAGGEGQKMVAGKENKQPDRKTRVPSIGEDAGKIQEETAVERGQQDDKKLRNDHDSSPKRKATKRGRGDQIFDYFQPLKKMKKDDLSSAGGGS